jgi:hypothetical protein
MQLGAIVSLWTCLTDKLLTSIEMLTSEKHSSLFLLVSMTKEKSFMAKNQCNKTFFYVTYE